MVFSLKRFTLECVVLQPGPFRCGKKFEPRPQKRIYRPLRGSFSFLHGTPGFETNVDCANPRWLEKSPSSCVGKFFHGIDWTGLFEHSLTLMFSLSKMAILLQSAANLILLWV